jgi:hypothetical protein
MELLVDVRSKIVVTGHTKSGQDFVGKHLSEKYKKNLILTDTI